MDRQPPAAPRFGDVLRRARLARAWTLADMVDRLRGAGLSCAKSYLSELENSRRPPPPDPFLRRAEDVLRLPAGTLTDAARWERTPPRVRAQVFSLQSQRRVDEQQRRRFVQRIHEVLADTHADPSGPVRGRLDAAFRSGELQRWVEELEGSPPVIAQPGAPLGGRERTPASPGGDDDAVASGPLRPVALPQEVPLINSVAAGYPREFTDLGYPARVADQYVRVPDIADADAFAARVVGDSMAPSYVEGDIVVFSPAREVKDGADCFARLEPDQETTFKRVYFHTTNDGEAMIRLQPINQSYPPRVMPREQVAGLYAAVTVMRRIG